MRSARKLFAAGACVNRISAGSAKLRLVLFCYSPSAAESNQRIWHCFRALACVAFFCTPIGMFRLLTSACRLFNSKQVYRWVFIFFFPWEKEINDCEPSGTSFGWRKWWTKGRNDRLLSDVVFMCWMQPVFLWDTAAVPSVRFGERIQRRMHFKDD